LIAWAVATIQWWSYSINSWSWQTETGIVYNGDNIKIQLTSSSAYSSTTTATLHIGGQTWTFSVTTKSAPWWWGGGGWWWGGWPVVKACTIADLICSGTTITGGIYIKKNLVTCEWGNLWMSCDITWIVVQTWNNSGNIFYQTLSPTLSPLFSPELNQAYTYAREIGITTVPSIERANLTGTLIRKHLAKMISNFTINVLNKKPNTWMHCTFEDMQNETSEMKFYAKLACQLWLMGLANDGTPNSNFYPELEVTRAQFGTVLSRALRGNTYNGWWPYYSDHLIALQAAEIMNQINTPEAKELRWYVMLMMMRAAE
jgi:DNA-binding transcriptional regulator YdaS (Cro superfamily)